MIRALKSAVALGIDIGTSGVRVAALAADGTPLEMVTFAFPDAVAARLPSVWWYGVRTCLTELVSRLSLVDVEGIAVDGTSGTVLAVDARGAPVGDVLMYNDACPDASIVDRIARYAPDDSPARGATSALARAIHLSRRPGACAIVHQADWILMQLGLHVPSSDENNALKTGYDLTAEVWPQWLEACGMDIALLPTVRRAGAVLSEVGATGRSLGLPSGCRYHAGTTDGCASFLATGAAATGDGVTALGSTLVVKLASSRPINAAEYGIYSHRILDFWLAGGASNSGGAVIRSFFDNAQLKVMTPHLRPDEPTGLGYYPLLKPGERFPVNDAAHPPRLEPRPGDDLVFFQAILEGITAIEKSGYDRLAALGGPAVRSVRSVGGGAVNPAWTRLRENALGVPFLPSRSAEAAVGTASLVLAGKARWS
ncbi:carbohydrate kinase [Agrobacterium tumefaciens]|uniref:FGGY-family carbohydrate kinase n=1 Tax=Agrobacterium TaxID=357 RepID=UPI000F6386CB|nr:MULTISPECIES: FGGY-family carbohydrate kinase [Agrobacterium]MDA5241205.1 FGGY-family carbohydrate kinase [Agrobacterium sp. MAFF310724]MDA5249476.1 FGGY-family carbohydrate kinase [Agrobacterium sp. MAFF210268]RRN70390.1 carbohydrate kinase [Agrobacterium deltaense]TRB13046.1 carbohydrate kinase [Agrobacterium tumefaciens]WCA61311.1 FGGY-family carbohydrate kinase [Agrobacterium tumefaciens]